jgi:hypothetical protein
MSWKRENVPLTKFQLLQKDSPLYFLSLSTFSGYEQLHVTFTVF